MNSPSDIPGLHQICVLALDAYMEQAQKSCELLRDIKDFPASVEQRNSVLVQRRVESDALSYYHSARNNLYEAAKWGT